ncbi:MAG: hypothetical protein ACRYHQ_28290 [Janthinobacterium lividum]
MAGELQGHGRLGSMVGPWTPIPAEAWEVLQVPCALLGATDFTAWRRGHLVGPGMEFWGARILDPTGLSLKAAALAYGPAEAVSVAQRGMAFGHTKPLPPPKPKSLAARMAAAEIPQLGSMKKPDAVELADALRSLRQSVIQQLRDGSLVADAENVAGLRRPVEATEWLKGRVDFGVSVVMVGRMRLGAVRVRQCLKQPAAITAAKAVVGLPQKSVRKAGRPTSTPFAEAEMIRRAEQGELAPGIGEQARQLCEWLRQTHPEEPQPRPKSLAAALGPQYRLLKLRQNRGKSGSRKLKI